MASRIPTSTSITESSVIEASFSDVWHLIKLDKFADFWSKLKSSAWVEDGTSSEAAIVKFVFHDGHVLELKQEEHSAIDHYITYSVISAQPPLPYSSVTSRIRCFPITSGKHEGHTFVEWSNTFSNDADISVIEDAKFKRREALEDLAKAAAKVSK